MVDRTMVLRAQAGDREAYETLARASARRLFVVADRILRDADLAEDAVQQTLVLIWRDLPSLRDPDRFEAWTYRIVVRCCHAEARRRRAEVRVVDLSDDLARSVDPTDDVVRRDQLDRAFASLDLDHRTVVVLRHLVGLPLGEIAEILDVPYGTAGSRLHTALRRMRAALEADESIPLPGGQPA
jgi:RNA polymerase sigma-70 factor (ECF subfamily)